MRTCTACAQPNRVLAHARRSFEQGDAFSARKALEDSIAKHSGDFRLELAYAAVLLQDGDLELGLLRLDTLSTTHPWSPVVQAYRGGALLALGRVTDAADVLDDAYARAPDDFYVLLKRGELFCRLGVFDTAVDALERALRTPVDDRLGRAAARRLLRFARDKAQRGFVRQATGAKPLRLSLKWLAHLRPRLHASTDSHRAWGL